MKNRTSDFTITVLRYIILSILIFSLVDCGGKKRNPLSNLRSAPGEVYYGGTFRYNEVSNLRSLYPLDLTDVVSSRVASQIYEGLVSFSTFNLAIEPGIAERWEIDSTHMVYTFYLRKGVRFHPDECFPNKGGRELNAADVKYCFDKFLDN